MPRYILAPYVATPPEVIEYMLQLGQVGADDVVYDLGCGDGRMLIAAAQLGACGVGVDIEPYWIELANTAATGAGLADRARFQLCDALALDCSDASVVLAYLMPWSTQMVAAQLLKQCRPGTRVVSHSFAFEAVVGQTRSEHVQDASGQSHSIHLWVIGEVPGQPRSGHR